MVLPFKARNFVNSLVGGGKVPLCIATTDKARFNSSKEAAFSVVEVDLCRQPVINSKPAKQTISKRFMERSVSGALVVTAGP